MKFRIEVCCVVICLFANSTLAQKFLWTKPISTGLYTKYSGIAIDHHHNIIASGSYDFVCKIDTTILSVNYDYGGYLTKFDSNGNVLWVRGLHVKGPYMDIRIKNVTVDSDDNIFIAGFFNKPFLFFSSIDSLSAGVTGGSSFFAKYDSSGNFLWANCTARPVDNISSCTFDALTLDNQNSIIVSGLFSGKVEFSSDTLTDTGSIAAAYITKYTSSGSLIWAKKCSSQFGIDLRSLATDSLDNIYATGYVTGDAVIDTGIVYAGPDTGVHIITSKFDANGNYIWGRVFKYKNITESNEVGNSIAVGKNGDVFVGGSLTDSTTWSYYHVLQLFDVHAVVLKYSSTGSLLWQQHLKPASYISSSIIEGNGIVLDRFGDPYFTGNYDTALKVDTTILPQHDSGNIFICKLDSKTGKPLWTVGGGGVHRVKSYGIAIDQYNNKIGIIGPFLHSAIFGDSTVTAYPLYVVPNGMFITYMGNYFNSNTGDTTNAVAITNKNSKNISLYPNPTSGTFYLRGSINDLSYQFGKIRIVNPLGQVVYEDAVEIDKGILFKEISLQAVPGAMYFLELRADKTYTFPFTMVHK
jgi:hypothetical protein